MPSPPPPAPSAPAYVPPPREEVYVPPAPRPYTPPPVRVPPPEVVQERPRRTPPPQHRENRDAHDSRDFSADHDHELRPWEKPKDPDIPYCDKPRRDLCAYKVEAGETLTAIAREHYGACGPSTIRRIVAVNPGLDPDRIYVGQTLYLPRGSSADASTPACPCRDALGDHLDLMPM